VILDPDLTFAQRVAALIIPQLTQFTIGNFLEPILFGDQLNLHPAIVLLSLTLWGSIWGITGMIMSVPITSGNNLPFFVNF
jgi:predicted PurR-regulated permease PerM